MKILNKHSCLLMVLFIVFTLKNTFAQKHKPLNTDMVRVVIRMADASKGDTIRLMAFDRICNAEYKELREKHDEYTAVKNVNGDYIFNIPVKNKLRFISIYKDKILKDVWPESFVCIIRGYIIEPNDKINIDIIRDDTYHEKEHLISDNQTEIQFQPYLKYLRQYKLSFSGTSVPAFNLRYKLDQLLSGHIPLFETDTNGVLKQNPVITAGLDLCNKLGHGMNSLIFNIIKLDFLSKVETQQLWALSVSKRYDLMNQFIARLRFNSNSEASLYSRFYPYLLLAIYDQMYPNQAGAKTLTTGSYFYLKQDYAPGELRDRLLTLYLLRSSERLQNSVFDDAKNTIKDPAYHDLVLALSNSLSPGKKAYNFELTDLSGKKVKLSDFEGKVVFLDFWFTGCSACKGYFRDIVSKVEDRMKADTNVVFVTISIDRNHENWVKSVNEGSYTSERAINLHTNGEGALHPVIKAYQVQLYPRTVLIDKKGRIFTDKDVDLRSNGVETLTNKINEALKL